MSTPSPVLALASLAALLSASACAGGGPMRSPDDDDDDTTEDAGLYAVAGILGEPGGAPVVGLIVSVSTESCIASLTDSAGRFRVEDVSPGPKRLVAYGSTAEYQWPSFSAAFEAPDDGADYIFPADFTLPALVEQVAVDPESPDAQEVALAGGLSLSWSAGSLSLAPLSSPLLRSGYLETGDGSLWELPAGVLRLFAVEPILSRFDPPAGIEISIDGLTPDSQLGLWSLDYDSGLFVQEATLTVAGDGSSATSDGESGITMLGWHVLAPLEDS